MFDEHHCPCQPGWGHMSIFMSHCGQRKLDILAFSSRFYTIPVDGASFTHSRDTNIPQTKPTIGNFSWIVLSNQKFKASEPTVQPSFFLRVKWISKVELTERVITKVTQYMLSERERHWRSWSSAHTTCLGRLPREDEHERPSVTGRQFNG